jgi:hypothetical protein
VSALSCGLLASNTCAAGECENGALSACAFTSSVRWMHANLTYVRRLRLTILVAPAGLAHLVLPARLGHSAGCAAGGGARQRLGRAVLRDRAGVRDVAKQQLRLGEQHVHIWRYHRLRIHL